MPPYSLSPEGRRAYYAANREHIRAREKARAAASPEYRARRAAGMRAHRQANLEEHRARDRARAANSLYFRAKVRCVRCGYDRCRGALQWHHVNPATKVDQPSALKRRPHLVVAEELLKCVVLCANCHWEVELKTWVVIDEHRRQSDAFVLDTYRAITGDDYPDRPEPAESVLAQSS